MGGWDLEVRIRTREADHCLDFPRGRVPAHTKEPKMAADLRRGKLGFDCKVEVLFC